MKIKNKRLILIVFVIALIAAAVGVYLLTRPVEKAPVVPDADENLLQNGDFSLLNENDMPTGWFTDAYFVDADTYFDVTSDGAHIQNDTLNDARFGQRVPVQPDTLYCLSGEIRANAENGLGANLSVEGVYAFSPSVFQSEDAWQQVSLYGRTGKDQDFIIVFARLGGYGGESTGEAWFRNLSLTTVSQVPENEIVYNFFVPQPFLDNEESEVVPANQNGETASSLILFFCIFFAGLFLCLKDRLSLASPLTEKTTVVHRLLLAGMLIIALAARIFAAIRVPGYDVDIGCFTYWARAMVQHGPSEFYNSVSFCDYPPGYMYVLVPVGLIGNWMGSITELMVKMPSIISDMLICILLYTEGKKRMNQASALLLSAFWAFNPVSFAAGACWGQTDSLMTLLLLLSVFSLMNNRWKLALPIYVIAVLVKPQALMFGPMGVAALALHLKSKDCHKDAIKDVLIGIAASALVLLAMVLPFVINISPEAYLRAKGMEDDQITALLKNIAQDPAITHVEGYALGGGLFNQLFNGIKFIFSLYGNTMSSYAGATINACNIYFLLDLNWAPVNDQAPFAAVLLPLLLSSLPALIGTLNLRKKIEEQHSFLLVSVLFVAVLALLFVLRQNGRLTFETLSTVMICYIVLQGMCLFVLQGEMRKLPVFAAAMLTMLFSCCGMMHERYLLPVIVLLLVGYITTKDKRLLYLMMVTTIASFINISCVLDRNIRIGGAEAHLNAPLFSIQSDLYILEYLSAGLTCLCAGLCLYLAVSPERAYTLPETKKAEPFKITRRDVIIILLVTCLYSVPAFVNLGATTSPQTAWTASNYETINPGTENEEFYWQPETVLLDLGEEKQFSVQFFSGIHLYFDASFTVESGSTPDAFSDYRTGNADQGNCFQWKYVTGTKHDPMIGRYVKITSENDKLQLFELILRDFETNEILPYTIVSSSNNSATVANLCDEQSSMAGDVPSWYNSTYFDEIYHARTAYEHLHAMQPYETSHPPLGKVLMSWAIAIFGMTPFGWRFAGALAGVLMLPGMYLLGKMLSKNKWGGLFAMLMMAFDLMHFTQTRIATIDSFVVLFIIWSVYFMLRWFRMDFYEKPFWKTLVPLFLSGVFMGLSIASKWTGVYNIIALAIIFFWGFFLRFKEWLHAKKQVDAYHNALSQNYYQQLSTPKKQRDSAPMQAVQSLSPGTLAIHQKGRNLLATIGLCVLFFIVIPLTIYYLSYIPYFAYDGEGVTVDKVISAAVGDYLETGELDSYDGMLGYHSQEGLGMDHPYYTPWYEWPVIAKPMYYYAHSGNTPDASSTITLMGNPAVWWVGLIGLIGVVCMAIWRHMRYDIYKMHHPEKALQYPIHTLTLPWDPRFAVLILCFLVQYMPWVLVPRGTYIYHYFTSIPFIILSAGLCLDLLHERWPRATKMIGILILLFALLLFIGFFPYASGVFVSQKWLRAMQWFDNWIYFAAW